MSSPAVDSTFQDPYSETSMLGLQAEISNAVLDNIPLFRLAETLLHILAREKEIRLTGLGYLPKKILTELYQAGHLPDADIESGLMKLNKEEHYIQSISMRYSLEFAGMIKRRGGKLSLTRKGMQLTRSEKFRLFLMAYTEKLNWSMHDGYPDYPIGQHGWAYSVLLLLQHGTAFRKADYYAKQYLKVFPEFVDFFEEDLTGSEAEQLSRCYALRTFERFTQWFNFTEARGVKKGDHDEAEYRSTPLLRQLFSLKKS